MEQKENAQQPLPPVSVLGFGDALRIARGCHDYNGGHHTDGHYDAYHHGLQTVINVLEAAEKVGLNDTQVAAVWCIGGEKPNAAAEARRTGDVDCK